MKLYAFCNWKNSRNKGLVSVKGTGRNTPLNYVSIKLMVDLIFRCGKGVSLEEEWKLKNTKF